MVFVELTPFLAFCKEYWTDEDLRAMQKFLLATPDAGDLIRGGAGLRSCVGRRRVVGSGAAHE
jgi:hypothetical protein